MTRFYVALLALALSIHPAAAQQWTVGDQGADWTNGISTKPVGALPMDAYEPAEVALPAGVSESVWRPSRAAGANGFNQANGMERKIRLECEPAGRPQFKDNILGKGIAKFGHAHQGAGLINWTENTTYTTIRTTPISNCAGGPLIASNYMEPAFLKQLSSGAIVSVVFQNQINYYINGQQGQPQTETWLRRGSQFVMGANPSNFNDTARRTKYAAGGFAYPGSPVSHAGQLGYYCVTRGSGGSETTVTVSDTASRMQAPSGIAVTTKSRWLRGPGNIDPWGGGCASTAYGPAIIVSDLLAPGCNDPHNMTSPDGRGHQWYRANKPDNSAPESCPKTTSGESYAAIPELEVKNFYETTGFVDYGTWYLGSDRMRMPTTECPDAAAPCDGVSGGNVPATVAGVYYSRNSISNCRRTGLDFCNGETLHADYTYGQSAVFDQMMLKCLGIPVRGATAGQGAECGVNTVDETTYLYQGAVSAPNRIWTGGCAVLGQCSDAIPSKPSQWYRSVPKQQQGTVHIGH